MNAPASEHTSEHTPGPWSDQRVWDVPRARLIAAAPELLELLALMFGKYENGEACYEDPGDCAGFLGNAINLSEADENRIIALLNRLAPVEQK